MTVSAVMVGAGERGHHVYGRWALANPERMRFVAVADPDPARRQRFAEPHSLNTSAVFDDPLELLGQPRLADAAVIASPDRYHQPHVEAALAAGYHVLAEKPMADTLEGCVAVMRAAAQGGGKLHIGHVFRFTPFFQVLNEVLTSGALGDIVTVEHRENVRSWHMAHSFVRGNWGKRTLAPPFIVAKCTHDLDILQWNLQSPVIRLSSFGSLFEFRPERAPEGATARCTDPCPVPDCPYDARRLYLDPKLTGWPVHVVTDDFSPAGRLRAITEGPYGICAYRAGSDVVDHQTVAMQLASGATVTLIAHGHSPEEGRTMRYDGTRATLRGRFGRVQEIVIYDHITGEGRTIPVPTAASGHGGGDAGIIESFLASIEGREPPVTTAAESFESHLLAFLAEEARLNGSTIDVVDRRSRASRIDPPSGTAVAENGSNIP
jgi:predicted dehydrogenase